MALLSDPPYFTTNEFVDLLCRVQQGLKYAFNTENRVLLGTGSGSLGMQAAVLNFFEENDDVLILDHGKYGQNWSNMCSNANLSTIQHRTLRGKGVHPDTIYNYHTSKNFDPKGVFITHVETTTGIKAPLPLYVEAIRDSFPNALIIVDAVSSLLSETICDQWYDVAISASQKGLQCPPGMFMMAVNDRAIERHKKLKKSKNRFLYFDVENEVERTEKHITTFTPAAYVVAALDVALDAIARIGRERVIEHGQRCRDMIRRRLGAHFNLFTDSSYLSNAISVFEWDAADHLVDDCERHGLIIGRGLRENSGKVFRIMHFGWDLSYRECAMAVDIIESLTHPYP